MGYSVYCHLNKTNGKMYFGQTIREPRLRWGGDGNHYRQNASFWSDIQEYGWNGFEHIVLYSGLTHELADSFERLLIDAFNTTDSTYGYNREEGGVGGYTVLSEVRQQISDTLKTRYTEPDYVHPMQGKHHTEESKQKMREAKLGKKFTEEHKQKLRSHLQGLNIGRKASDEARRKMGEVRKGKVWVTDNQHNKLILPAEIDNYIGAGYRLGITKNKNNI